MISPLHARVQVMRRKLWIEAKANAVAAWELIKEAGKLAWEALQGELGLILYAGSALAFYVGAFHVAIDSPFVLLTSLVGFGFFKLLVRAMNRVENVAWLRGAKFGEVKGKHAGYRQGSELGYKTGCEHGYNQGYGAGKEAGIEEGSAQFLQWAAWKTPPSKVPHTTLRSGVTFFYLPDIPTTGIDANLDAKLSQLKTGGRLVYCVLPQTAVSHPDYNVFVFHAIAQGVKVVLKPENQPEDEFELFHCQLHASNLPQWEFLGHDNKLITAIGPSGRRRITLYTIDHKDKNFAYYHTPYATETGAGTGLFNVEVSVTGTAGRDTMQLASKPVNESTARELIWDNRHSQPVA